MLKCVSLIMLIIVTPAYQSCERNHLMYEYEYNENGNRYNVYEVICYGHDLHYYCDEGVDYLTIESNDVSLIDKSIFELNNCYVVRLSMTNCKIEKILPTAFSKFNHLKNIDLAENNISNILDGTFVNENSVQILNISRNKIEDFSEHTLYGLNNLNELILHHNRLKKFRYSYLKDKTLDTLDLSFNNITQIISDIASDNFSVTTLDLSYNSIKNLSKDFFLNPKYLQHLKLSGNKIEQIPIKTFFECHILLSLNLSDNRLNNLQFGVFNNLDNLQILDLSSNKLVTNDLHTTLGLKSLSKFYFNDNEISEFDINLFPANLTEISFYGNKFKFTCQQLSQIVLNLHKKGLEILKGKDYENANLNGIACNNFTVSITDSSSANSTNKGNFEQLNFIQSIKTFNERINNLIQVNEKSAKEVNKNLEVISEAMKEQKIKDKTNAININDYFEKSAKEVNKNLQAIFEVIKEQKIKDKSNSMNDYFETKFKETNFYKFFKNFKAIEINTLNNTSNAINNTALTERLVSSYLAPEEDSLLKSISVQFTIILVLIIGFLIVMVVIRRNWILNQLRLRNTANKSNADRINLTVATTASSVESLEMRNA